MVTTSDLRQKIDARKLTKYEWVSYDLKHYRGRCGYIKDKKIKGRVTIFLTGKMISIGSRSVTESIEQLTRARNLLARNHLIKPVKLIPKVQNIVVTVNLGKKIDLHGFASYVPKVTYEPDQFPGAILRMTDTPVCLLFATGKLVIVGLKSEDGVKKTMDKLDKILRSFYIQ